jgi:hypothetical protein
MWARGRFTLTDILFGRQVGSGYQEIEFQEIETGGRKFFSGGRKYCKIDRKGPRGLMGLGMVRGQVRLG